MTTPASKFTLFISDLHLDPERPDITQAFLAFLQSTARSAEALYILGDFFNVWIGDDNQDTLSQQIALALKQLTNSGTAVYLLHGNRDFLLGNKYAEQAGATLIEQPYLTTIYNSPLLLLHGDSLCTLDTEYMKFRNIVRSPKWQQEFLSQPLPQRKEFAQRARQQSNTMNSNKAEDIMDVTPAAVLEIMQQYKVDTMIHGHTHRPAIHHITVAEKPARRVVLGDWDQQLWYLKLRELRELREVGELGESETRATLILEHRPLSPETL